MQRLLLLVAVLALLVEVYGLVSCVLMPADRVRTAPKWLWLLLMIVFPLLGAIAWIAVGRERAVRTAPERGPAPDDDPVSLGTTAPWRSRAALAEQDERIARLEAELAALDSEADDGDGPRSPGSRPGA